MLETAIPFYLASQSPRRKKLLELLNIKFEILSIDFEEIINDGEHPVRTVKRLAKHKNDYAQKQLNEGIILTADTIVVLKDKILGKPKDKEEAEKMLSELSGKTHKVYTGFMLSKISENKKISEILSYEKTSVTFRNLSQSEIINYIGTGSPFDKAGGYGIQDDFGSVFVKKISGCYYNVVGLPLSHVYSSIKKII